MCARTDLTGLNKALSVFAARCVNCPEGFDGPRCQQLRHSFDGRSYALYPTLEQCEDSETSIEFITNQVSA